VGCSVRARRLSSRASRTRLRIRRSSRQDAASLQDASRGRGQPQLFAPCSPMHSLARSRTKVADSRGRDRYVSPYAPFYFDGNYPGGGARFYGTCFPLEHSALAWALTRFGLHGSPVPLALLGFAFATELRSPSSSPNAKEAGPYVRAVLLEHHRVNRGSSLRVDGPWFNLGFEPTHDRAPWALVVAPATTRCARRDLWEASGAPTSTSTRTSRVVVGLLPSWRGDARVCGGEQRFEAESSGPPFRFGRFRRSVVSFVRRRAGRGLCG